MTAKQIAGLIPTMYSVALLGENLKILNKKKTKSKDFLGLGMKNIIGTSLIKVESDIIAGL